MYGHKFLIRSDHKPLHHIFNESKGIPVMASARLQRWALTLSAYNYVIEHCPGKNLANADALSRLPLTTCTSSDCLPGELIHLMNHLISIPLTASAVKILTEKDPVLAQVKRFVMSGWPSQPLGSEFQPYVSKHELSIWDGCLLWGSRLIVPPPGRNINAQIEQVVKQCSNCQQNQYNPPAAPVHLWNWPDQPWVRLHLDFAGPFLGHMYLILVDAFSKWIDVEIMHSITSSATIEELQSIFSIHGLLRTLVTDNGSAFTSKEFQSFVQSNGIQHITSAPYHPSTNGLAERMVQCFKEGLKRIQGGTLQSRISRFLFHYRITPHTATGLSPAELLMGRCPRSKLDLLFTNIPNKMEQYQQKMIPPGKSTRLFKIDDKVFARDFRTSGQTWLPLTRQNS